MPGCILELLLVSTFGAAADSIASTMLVRKGMRGSALQTAGGDERNWDS